MKENWDNKWSEVIKSTLDDYEAEVPGNQWHALQNKLHAKPTIFSLSLKAVAGVIVVLGVAVLGIFQMDDETSVNTTLTHSIKQDDLQENPSLLTMERAAQQNTQANTSEAHQGEPELADNKYTHQTSPQSQIDKYTTDKLNITSIIPKQKHKKEQAVSKHNKPSSTTMNQAQLDGTSCSQANISPMLATKGLTKNREIDQTLKPLPNAAPAFSKKAARPSYPATFMIGFGGGMFSDQSNWNGYADVQGQLCWRKWRLYTGVSYSCMQQQVQTLVYDTLKVDQSRLHQLSLTGGFKRELIHYNGHQINMSAGVHQPFYFNRKIELDDRLKYSGGIEWETLMRKKYKICVYYNILLSNQKTKDTGHMIGVRLNL